jgi:hypothetical protein
MSVLVILKKNLNVSSGLIAGKIGFMNQINVNQDGSIEIVNVDFGINLRNVRVCKTNTSHIKHLIYDGILLSNVSNFHQMQGVKNLL